ncbi:MAG: nuclear transport factor 2 family protein [Hydrogenophaga sp.]|uniref:nuclear transport factor 2 family protein n=1 Tax=Hydrogenophaga sp. TaxID=1904254 RepID=UPI00260B354C|nr:nuclear transport factor 2 family protein [Hydrogenophaga sp.]MCW5669528.1 nuclear transport factor 2 family protein [Hydrogenophaga sp.]
MAHTVLDTWHDLVRTRHASGLRDLLADEVVFHSPVVHTPQTGKAVTTQYLAAAFQVFFNASFRYVREVVGPRDAVLEFQVEIDGVTVNGVDMIRWNEEGRITDFKVMIRPLKAINLIHQKMGAMLQAQQQ